MNHSNVSKVFKAMGDETRTKILQMLGKESLHANDILKEFNISQPTLSYHMKVLEEAKLVNAKKEGVWVTYSINPQTLFEIQVFFHSLLASEKEIPELFDFKEMGKFFK